MDLKEIRRLRLIELIREAGGQAELASRLDAVRPDSPRLSPTYVSRMKSTGKHQKRVTGDMARDLEIAFRKPAGWMSTMPEQDTATRASRPNSKRTPETHWPLSISIADFQALSPRTQRELDEAFTKMVLGAQAQELLDRQRKSGAR